MAELITAARAFEVARNGGVVLCCVLETSSYIGLSPAYSHSPLSTPVLICLGKYLLVCHIPK